MSRKVDLQGVIWIRTRPQTYPGSSGEEEPRSFDFGMQQLDVLEILDHWSTDYAYFKVRVKAGRFYVLRRARARDDWEVTQLSAMR
jgi:hypothetical protein